LRWPELGDLAGPAGRAGVAGLAGLAGGACRSCRCRIDRPFELIWSFDRPPDGL
jgi:hypothetical protein